MSAFLAFSDEIFVFLDKARKQKSIKPTLLGIHSSLAFVRSAVEKAVGFIACVRGVFTFKNCSVKEWIQRKSKCSLIGFCLNIG